MGETNKDDTSSVKQNSFSFKVKTKSANKVITSAPDNFSSKEGKEHEDKEYITATSEKDFKSRNKDPSKLVIPLIVKNKWLNQSEGVSGDNLTKQALDEILNDLNEDEYEDKEVAAIPLIMRNKLPPSKDGVTDERYDISIRPEESSIDDYESIPVTSFGAAMLRGMGWSEKKPIGGVNKGICEPIEYIPRHKGLGLGAEKTNLKVQKPRKRKMGDAPIDDSKYRPIVDSDGRVRHIKKVGEEVPEQTKTFVPGKRVILLKEPHKDLYGKIISVAEDTTRISVMLSISREVVQISQYNARIVDKIPSHSEIEKPTAPKNDRLNESNSDKKIKQKDSRNGSSSSKSSHWLQPHIKVRIISRSFKGGRYYNKKAKILDVASIDTCTCKTEENKILDNVREEYLETIVPKSKGSYVMILNGKYKGNYAKLVDRKKSECAATVELLSNKHITTVSFDNIAEFLGELPEDEFL